MKKKRISKKRSPKNFSRQAQAGAGKNTSTATLELGYLSGKDATLVDAATRQDNEDFVATRISGNRVVATVSAKSIPSLLHTVDDYLECIAVAERIISEKGIKRKAGNKN